MTCIVGIEKDGLIYIGGDSASTSGDYTTATRLEKVFIVQDFIIGHTGSMRDAQLLRYQLVVDPKPGNQDDLEYLTTVFVDAVRACLGHGGTLEVDSSVEKGTTFLLGYNGRLYSVFSDMQVNADRGGYAAIGSGADWALGSLWSTRNIKNESIRIREALGAAGHFCNTVCPPYYFHCLD